MSDDARSKILARRASFVAAALAGVTTACHREPKAAEPETLVVPTLDAGAPPPVPPRPCLEPPRPDWYPGPSVPDAGATTPSSSEDAGHPRPCLKIAPPEDAGSPRRDAGVPSPARPVPTIAPPQPCLSPLPRPPGPTKGKADIEDPWEK